VGSEMCIRDRYMQKFEQWQPTRRIEPTVQLESRRPLLRREDYRDVEKCDTPVSNQGPAAENSEKTEDLV